MDDVMENYLTGLTGIMLEHVSHDVVIVTYGAEPVNVSLECEQCGLVLWDADLDV